MPGGDGLNVFARVPVYNETRTTWDSLYGVIDDGADEMTPKGILYTVLGGIIYMLFFRKYQEATRLTKKV